MPVTVNGGLGLTDVTVQECTGLGRPESALGRPAGPSGNTRIGRGITLSNAPVITPVLGSQPPHGTYSQTRGRRRSRTDDRQPGT
jgi:hypothetical protein